MSFFKNLFKKRTNYNNLSDFGLPDIEHKLLGRLFTQSTGIPATDVFDRLAIETKLKEAMNTHFISYTSHGSYSKLYEEGTFYTSIRFEAKGKKYSLFLLYDENDARKFNAAKKFIKNGTHPNALFISPYDYSYVNSSLSCLEPFQLENLSLVGQKDFQGLLSQEETTFAMWFPSEAEKTFYNSPIKLQLDAIYALINDYENYVYGYLLLKLKIPDIHKFHRPDLPEVPQTFLILAIENTSLLITVCKEKGIRFHFNKQTTSTAYVAHFLKHMHSDFVAFIAELQTVLFLEKTIGNGLHWYQNTASEFITEEKNGNLQTSFPEDTIIISTNEQN
ncbi:hypothetical protein [Cellulophaga sp. HaHa_2_1]|uniref:hypothetical protein n=1 Tax=Cellulophaga sp. HaHa_2_1 TaxID=2749994 RepID=UPI001C4EC774|nr:hypothetical protein [Cellulophaga sp. HaHa_2_1]QXP54120.1 hypothetical protein H0I24_09395 [Cellulophaga sp. HaHa_2_1]